MPELPEVETVLRNVGQSTIGLSVVEVRLLCDKLRQPVPASLPSDLLHRRLVKVTRRGKYLLFSLDKEQTLVIHLGMTGWLLLVDQLVSSKQDCLQVKLSDGNWLVFRNPRRLGLIDLVTQPWPAYLTRLGAEPFSSQFNYDYLAAKIKSRRCAIKQLLLDQQVIAGLGNIYSNEVLFRLKVSPLRQANQLSEAEKRLLVAVVKEVLAKAIALTAPSIKAYQEREGKENNYQIIFSHLIRPSQQHSETPSAPEVAYNQLLAVYARGGLPCRQCGNQIKRVLQQGRASFYCPSCQK